MKRYRLRLPHASDMYMIKVHWFGRFEHTFSNQIGKTFGRSNKRL